MAPFRWTRPATLAAQLVADGEHTYPEIAEKVGITRETLYAWRQKPEFKVRVEAHMDEFRARVRRRGIAILERRVDALQGRWRKMQEVIEARALAYAGDAHGGATGLVCRTVRWEGTGDDRKAVYEYEVDVGLLKELREHEKQAAQELGQWTEKKEIGGDPNNPVIVKVLRNVGMDEL